MQEHDDPGGDTAAFQAFQDAADYRPERSRAFRLLSLLAGLLIFAASVLLLLQ